MESYQHLFNLTPSLAHALSLIISQTENEEYCCFIKLINIEEHIRLIPGYKENSIKTKKGYRIPKTISQNTYYYFILGSIDKIKILGNSLFLSQDSIEEFLNRLGITYQEYDGVFNMHTVIRKFPYLTNFFVLLNNWRNKTGRVSLDKEIIEESLQVVLNKEKNLSPSLIRK